MRESKTEKKSNAIWDFFGSVKLAIVLLIILAIVSVFGTIIPQREGAMEFARELEKTLGAQVDRAHPLKE